MNLSFLPKSFEEEALQLPAIAAGSTGCDEFMPRPTGEVARSCVGQLQIQIWLPFDDHCSNITTIHSSFVSWDCLWAERLVWRSGKTYSWITGARSLPHVASESYSDYHHPACWGYFFAHDREMQCYASYLVHDSTSSDLRVGYDLGSDALSRCRLSYFASLYFNCPCCVV